MHLEFVPKYVHIAFSPTISRYVIKQPSQNYSKVIDES